MSKEKYDNLDLHLYPADKELRLLKLRNKAQLETLKKDLTCLERGRRQSVSSMDRERLAVLNKLNKLKKLQISHSESSSPVIGSPAFQRKNSRGWSRARSRSSPSLSEETKNNGSMFTLPKVVVTPCEDATNEPEHGMKDGDAMPIRCCPVGNCACVRARANSLDRTIDFDRFPSLGRFVSTHARRFSFDASMITSSSPMQQASLHPNNYEPKRVEDNSRLPTPFPTKSRPRLLSMPHSLLKERINHFRSKDKFKLSRSADDVRIVENPEHLPQLSAKGKRGTKLNSAPTSPRITKFPFASDL